MGRWHAHELTRAGGRLVAVADPDGSAAASLAARYSPAHSVGSLEQALRATPADVIHLCTPTETHVDLIKEGVAAGIHLVVEKPLAPHAEATEEVLRLAQERGVILCPVHQYLFQPGTVAARRRMAEIGPLVHLEATACSAGGREGPVARLDETAADVTPHALSVLERLLPGGLASVEWRGARPREGELRAAGAGKGLSVELCVSMNGRPTRNELRAIGERGTLHLDFFHGYQVYERPASSRARKVVHPFELSGRRSRAAAGNLVRRALRWEPAYPGLRGLITALYEAIRDDGPAPIASAESLSVARVRDLILVDAA